MILTGSPRLLHLIFVRLVAWLALLQMSSGHRIRGFDIAAAWPGETIVSSTSADCCAPNVLGGRRFDRHQTTFADM